MINSEKKAFVKKLKFDDDNDDNLLFSDATEARACGDEPENSTENRTENEFMSNSANEEIVCAESNTNANLHDPPQVPANSLSIEQTQCERYQLVSIICHISNSIGVGHYVSYVFNFKHSKWFLCNDQVIREVPYSKLMEETSRSSLCYFYVHTKD